MYWIEVLSFFYHLNLVYVSIIQVSRDQIITIYEAPVKYALFLFIDEIESPRGGYISRQIKIHDIARLLNIFCLFKFKIQLALIQRQDRSRNGYLHLIPRDLIGSFAALLPFPAAFVYFDGDGRLGGAHSVQDKIVSLPSCLPIPISIYKEPHPAGVTLRSDLFRCFN